MPKDAMQEITNLEIEAVFISLEEPKPHPLSHKSENPVPGDMWYDSSTGNIHVWYDGGTGARWVQAP